MWSLKQGIPCPWLQQNGSSAPACGHLSKRPQALALGYNKMGLPRPRVVTQARHSLPLATTKWVFRARMWSLKQGIPRPWLQQMGLPRPHVVTQARHSLPLATTNGSSAPACGHSSKAFLALGYNKNGSSAPACGHSSLPLATTNGSSAPACGHSSKAFLALGYNKMDLPRPHVVTQARHFLPLATTKWVLCTKSMWDLCPCPQCIFPQIKQSMHISYSNGLCKTGASSKLKQPKIGSTPRLQPGLSFLHFDKIISLFEALDQK